VGARAGNGVAGLNFPGEIYFNNLKNYDGVEFLLYI
jgi:hypothetical protein